MGSASPHGSLLPALLLMGVRAAQSRPYSAREGGTRGRTTQFSLHLQLRRCLLSVFSSFSLTGHRRQRVLWRIRSDTGHCHATAKSCTVSGSFSDSTTQTSISNLQNALGITVSAQAMGTFTGTTIADEANVKGRCCQASHLSRLRGLEGTRALIATQNLSLTTEC